MNGKENISVIYYTISIFTNKYLGLSDLPQQNMIYDIYLKIIEWNNQVLQCNA